ncbi:efflux RND transporter periplasmic adaptor subunit [Cellulophaga sp. F20128]|uniref:efflux RND transporter periplasmic adaptor subunit n=1 Tax=Cellulophaga sp. F20128 TaxID=2926413 RepID=UPI001FF52DF1|nr:efflux RND transporter periplasmic adaptor subunit [Cellulophaga sp. F20128]MCK0156145.1 efflux RND transporter periplasmic adaptor subunit [Cellulophaga sp. F20128]
MKNNKIIIYVGLLLLGVLLGWLFFGGSSAKETQHNHTAATEANQMWTCSMHPQIMQPEAGDCPICGMDLIPAETSADGLLADQFKLTENAMALANVETTVVGESFADSENEPTLSGKITVNEDETAIQPAHFNGRIEKLFVTSLGEKVAKGQAVAKIYSPELIAAQQELITTYKLRESQPLLYKAVLAKFKNWKVHGPQLDEVVKTGNVKTSFIIYAHVSGVVTEIAVSDGAHIMDGKPIFKVSNLNTVWANFDVYENQISLFKKGQEVKVVTSAYPDKVFTAKVSFIDPILNPQTRTVNLRVVLNNKDQIFKPGMFVEGKIKISNAQKVQMVYVPASAVLWTGKRSVVYLQPDPMVAVFEMRQISLGNKVGGKYQVLEGLNDGDQIVTNGTFTVDAAAQLQGKKSMMNSTGGKSMTGHEGHLGLQGINSKVDNTVVIERVIVAKAFQNQLNAVYTDYLNVKDELVKDDFKKVVAKAKSLLANLAKVDMKLLTDEAAHTQWMTLEKEIKSAGASIATANEINVQRNHFKQLSSKLTNAIELFGINEKVYHQFCPMADSNNGAYWLSKEEKVSNPYFGEAMLKCGEVKQVIE